MSSASAIVEKCFFYFEIFVKFNLVYKNDVCFLPFNTKERPDHVAFNLGACQWKWPDPSDVSAYYTPLFNELSSRPLPQQTCTLNHVNFLNSCSPKNLPRLRIIWNINIPFSWISFVHMLPPLVPTENGLIRVNGTDQSTSCPNENSDGGKTAHSCLPVEACADEMPHPKKKHTQKTSRSSLLTWEAHTREREREKKT